MKFVSIGERETCLEKKKEKKKKAILNQKTNFPN